MPLSLSEFPIVSVCTKMSVVNSGMYDEDEFHFGLYQDLYMLNQ